MKKADTWPWASSLQKSSRQVCVSYEQHEAGILLFWHRRAPVHCWTLRPAWEYHLEPLISTSVGEEKKKNLRETLRNSDSFQKNIFLETLHHQPWYSSSFFTIVTKYVRWVIYIKKTGLFWLMLWEGKVTGLYLVALLAQPCCDPRDWDAHVCACLFWSLLTGAGSHYVVLGDLELAVYIKLVLNSNSNPNPNPAFEVL